MYGAPERPPFANPRVPLGGSKNLQWVRPGLNRPPTIPTKREFPTDDRDRAFGTAPKAPRLENNNNPSAEPQRLEQPRPDVRVPRSSSDGAEMKFQKSPEPKPIVASPRPSPIKTRRSSDISMPDVSPVKERPSLAAVPVPKDMEDSDEDFDLDEEDFAESEAKYHREKALLEAKLVDLTASQFRATTPLKEIVMLSNLSLEHLPQEEPKIADEEVLSSVVEPPPPESIATELLTPRAEEPEDVVMEDKQEPPMAPATRALRLRPEQLTEREATPPDVSALPYLVSGPPTPLSHPDHDRLSVPDSVLLAIRDKLKKDAAPEADPEDVLKEYAATYKRWRLSIQELDRDRGHDDQETTQYEPALKATTPDVNSASVAGFLDIPHTTGRRGYTSRFPTELDIEQVLKESLKTAEEERMGKKDKEPKILWDPEREATVPSLLSPYEIQRRRFIDTNFQREPGQGVLVYHYEPPEDDFTEAEHKVMVQHYRDQYAKKWGKLAEIIHKEVGTSRTYKDTINHYYATKWNKEFKHKTRRRGVGVRKRARKTVVERSDAHGDDTTTPLPLTDSGRPRRQAAPTFGTDADVDTTGATPTPGRQRRQPDVDGTQEKVGRRGKTAKEKGGRKAKSQQPLAAAPAPAPSPVKVDRKEKVQGVKAEEDLVKRQPEIPMPKQPIVPTQPPPPPAPLEEANIIQSDHSIHHGLGTGIIERPRSNTNTRLGPSSYWSVTEQTDFQRNVAHFGTDWAAIAHHMGTKTQTMVKNQYLRLVESGNSPELARLANEADKRRERGEDLGPPPTPTPAPKRRYDNTQTSVPRTLAPTPEVAELSRSPSMQPLSLPQFSPPHGATSRFPSIAQAPQPATNMVPTAVPVSVSEAPPAAPSKPRQLSPPPPAPPAQAQQRSSAVHHHNVLDQQHKPHSNGPRAGYFLDGPAPRGENRITSQQPIAHPPRAIQQQLQPHLRGQEQLQPHYRPAVQQDRESQARLEQQQEHDAQTRYQQHSRRISQEVPFPRQFPQNMQTSTQAMPSIQSTSGAASPEGRTLPQQQSRYGPPAPISNNTSQPDLTGQTPGSMAVPPQIQSRSSLRTPPVKEEPRQEPRHYPLPGHPPHSQQPPQIQAQPSVYPRPTQAPPPSSAPPPPPAPSKPASEPKKSSLLSLLNDVPEEPKRKKPNEAPSHTPTPQQQTPVAPPPPSNHATAPRRDFYSDSPNTQSPYSRSVYAQPANQPPQQHPPSARQIVDHASEQQASRHHPRESWQQRSYQPGQGSIQQANSLNSPHAALSQPNYGDSRMLGNHRSLLAQHNTSRPSPPPIGAYGNSPHMHSRNSSMSGPSSQQPRHSMSANNAPQAPATASQILQPNPYAQVEPPGNNPQQAGTVSMRSGPHHPTAAQQRDMQGRNEQAQVHNASLPYSGPQTPGEHHPGHQHLRGPSVSEQYRSREARDYRGFESQIPDRDSSRELAERGEYLLREQRESLLPRTGGPPQGHQDLRYQPPPQTERGYATQRSHTPLSRPEHTTHHATLQHPIAHSILPENRGLQYGQRPQEEPPHAYREAYPVRDDRHADRMREEQAYHARMRTEELMHRDRELRERDARYGQEMMRRDSRISGPPPPPPPPQQPHHEHRASHGGPMDWTSAVPRQQDRWPQQQQQQHPHQHQR